MQEVAADCAATGVERTSAAARTAPHHYGSNGSPSSPDVDPPTPPAFSTRNTCFCVVLPAVIVTR